MKKHLHTIVSLTLIITAAGLIFCWEMYLDETINTVKVIVAVKNLEKNQVIKPEDVKTERIKLEHAVDKPIQDIREVVGKETAQYIPKGHQFVERMVDKYNLEPNADQYIYSIPREWIYSSPGSLRRRDRVCIYPIPYTALASAGGNAVSDSSQPTKTTNPIITEIATPILKDIVVAFAKDSSNHEIKPVANSDKRIDATGSINNLELVMTETQYASLEKKFLEGYKFNFAYR